MLVELKQCFMEAYDDNQDGKIDIREVMYCNVLIGEKSHDTLLRAYYHFSTCKDD